jgi:GntR family transcriptional regulator
MAALTDAIEKPARSGDRSARTAVFTPLYKQIKQLLVSSLEQGEWKPGELIPSEFELAARYHVSQGTVRKAIDELAAENLVLRRQGKGTFVATHQEARVQFRFLRIVPDEGEPVPAQSRFLSCRRARADADIALLLGLRAGAAVIHVRRLLSFDDVPVVLDDLWLPAAIFKGLTAERLAAHHGPLYGLFESEFGTRMIRAEERLKALAADAQTAAALKVDVGAPVLLVDRVSYTYGDRAVEVRRGWCLTDRFHYCNALS